jgi:hypothetical protein
VKKPQFIGCFIFFILSLTKLQYSHAKNSFRSLPQFSIFVIPAWPESFFTIFKHVGKILYSQRHWANATNGNENEANDPIFRCMNGSQIIPESCVTSERSMQSGEIISCEKERRGQ